MYRENVEFALIVERGPLEAQAVLLCESIRRFAGRHSEARISVISPRAANRPAAATIAQLKAQAVHYYELDFDSPVPAYGTSLRVLGLGWLARQPGPPTLVQLDSDTVFVAEPELDLGDALMLAQPVDEVGMCSTGPADPRDGQWRGMCRVNGMEPGALGWLRTVVDRTLIRGSYNGGFIAARRELFSEAEACFERIVAANLRSWPGRNDSVRIGAGEAPASGYAWWGTSQAALSIAVARLGGAVRLLGAGHNFPLHLMDQMGPIGERLVHLHYHWLFADPQAAGTVLDPALPLDPAQRDWLRERLPLPLRVIEGTGVFGPATTSLAALDSDGPACSVVMTSYRDTRFLRAAVDSVIAQHFAEFELIVVDDGSLDPAPVAALAALDPRIRVLRLELNVGTAEAANRGIAVARAALIARLDSDDIAEPGWLGAVIGALRADPELGLVGSAVTLIDEQGQSIGLQPMPESDFAIRFALLFHSPFYHSTVAFRRKLFERVGGYRADQTVSQDHYLWAELLPHCRARNLAQALVRYRLNPAGLTATNSAGDPQARTAPIRHAAWREIGLHFPLANRRLAADASAILRGQPIADPARRAAACEVIGQALRRTQALAPEFIRPADMAEARKFAEDLRARLAAEAPPTPGLVARVWRSARRQGAVATLAAGIRRLRAGLPVPQVSRGNHTLPDDPIMAALHPVSPYDGFDPAPYPPDLQGWGSDDPVFRELVSELRPRLIIEVGSWKGASAIHMAGLCREFGLATRIICVDTWLGSSEHVLGRKPGWREALRPRHGYPQMFYTFLANVVRAGHAGRIVPLANTSENAAAVLREAGLRAELIYIDAAHEEEPVWRDLCNYWPLLAPGGAILGDDFAKYPGVRRAARRFAGEFGARLEDLGDKFVLRPAAAD